MLLAVTVCSFATFAPSRAHCEALAELIEAIDQVRQANNIPVVALSVMQGDTTTNRVLGADESVVLRWGSITKTITAMTLLGVMHQKNIHPDSKLSEHIDPAAWRNPWRTSHPVRVRQLLELTAGFTDLSSQEFNYNKPLSLARALALNPDHRVTRWPPGTTHSYSNMSLGLSQLLIETASGLAYEQAVQRFVLKPLMMHRSTTLASAPVVGGNRADGTTPIPYWHMTFPAFGALNAPVSDLALLVNALRTNSTLLIDDNLKATTALSAKAGLTFGYASGIYPRVRAGRIWYGHGGDADGYRSRYAYLANGVAGYAVNINVDNPQILRRIERMLETYLIDQLRVAAPRIDRGDPSPLLSPSHPSSQIRSLLPSLSQEWSKTISGRYYPLATRFGHVRWLDGSANLVSVTTQDNTVLVRRGTRTTKLFPVTDTLYRRAGDPQPTVAIFKFENSLYLQGELGNYAHLQACPKYLQAACKAAAARD